EKAFGGWDRVGDGHQERAVGAEQIGRPGMGGAGAVEERADQDFVRADGDQAIAEELARLGRWVGKGRYQSAVRAVKIGRAGRNRASVVAWGGDQEFIRTDQG